MFYYPIKLHYSQTTDQLSVPAFVFYYPIKLHYSQTIDGSACSIARFYYPIKLHYSQTSNLKKATLLAVYLYRVLLIKQYPKHTKKSIDFTKICINYILFLFFQCFFIAAFYKKQPQFIKSYTFIHFNQLSFAKIAF